MRWPVAKKETSEVEVVTPEKAAQWLESNTRNRRINQTHVRTMADEIIAGRWRVTHQGIAFGADGELYDGQHRLSAVVLANTSVSMRVTRGLPKASRDAIDVGKARQGADVLAIADGIKLGTHLRSLLCGAWWLSQSGNMSKHGRVTVHDLRDALKEHGEEAYAVWEAWGQTSNRLSKAGLLAALVITMRTSPEKTIEFTKLVRSGENMTSDHPAAALRDFVFVRYTPLSTGSMNDLAQRTLTAFEAFVDGRPVKNLKTNAEVLEKYLRPWRHTIAAKAQKE